MQTERVSLVAVCGDSKASLNIEIRNMTPATLIYYEGDTPIRFDGIYLSSCLRSLRLYLESKGWLLCCQGARPDVFPSGFLEDQSNGRLAYHHVPGKRLLLADAVDIFAPADVFQVSTVAEQDNFIRDSLKDAPRPVV